MKKFLPALLVPSLLLFAAPAFAQTYQFGPTATPAPRANPTPRGKQLANGPLRSCQAREMAIKNRMQSLTNLASNMEAKFDSIAIRVEQYYANKVVPGGKTVANYNSSVSDIATKKQAVATALTKAQTDTSGFSCTGDDPKGLFKTFRTDMQAVKTALKDYRTSIKNLIVAVRGVNK